MQLLLVSASHLETPDPETPLLASALERAGASARIVAWDDPDVDWQEADAAIVRSTWDYTAQRDEFLAWARHAAAATNLWNSAAVLEANSHKGYLLDLANAGLPVVPTILVRRGADPREALSAAAWDDVVVKPAVGAGGAGAMRVGEHDALAALEGVLRTGDALVQPFLPAVDSDGELSMVFVGGELIVTVRKLPGEGEFRVQEHRGGSTRRAAPPVGAEELARGVLATLDEPVMYARVDLVDGMVMELELVEPFLFLEHAEAGADRCAAALLRALAGRAEES